MSTSLLDALTEVEITLMRQIKIALDPRHFPNPGEVL